MRDLEIQRLLRTAEAIAIVARVPALSNFRQGLTVEDKSDESPVTAADRATERTIRDEIRRRFPDHGIIGEEFGEENTDRDTVWIIDPIDGTKSYISGMPLFGTLIGVMHQGEPILGIVSMPGLGELFGGSKVTGSRLNEASIRCRDVGSLDRAFLCCNELPSLMFDAPALADELARSVRYFRPSNDCYPYAQLAAGWIDAVIDCNLQPYDYIPLIGLVEGAGGVITDWNGQDLSLESDGRVAAAATSRLHRELLGKLRSAGS